MQRLTAQEPELFCINCRSKLGAVWMNFPPYLKATNREPHWAPLPCPVCEKKEQQRSEEQARVQLKQKRIDDLLTNSMLKKRFIPKTFDNFEICGNAEAVTKQTKALAIARDFADNFEKHKDRGTWLLMMGKPGTGKTHLCAAIINAIVRKGYTALFTKTFRLLRQVKDTYSANSAVTESELLSRLQTLDLLVIDEIGVQFGTDTERMILFDILDSRYEDMKPTIVTTNIVSIPQLDRLIGTRLLDRFFEGQSKLLLFDWESYRRFGKVHDGILAHRKRATNAPHIRAVSKDA